MVRCLRLRIDSRNVVTSSGLRMTGSLDRLSSIGESSTHQSRLSVTLYRKRSAPIVGPRLPGASLRSSRRWTSQARISSGPSSSGER